MRFIRKRIERFQRFLRHMGRRVGEFGSALVRPFERAVEDATRKVMHGADRVGDVEGLFGSLGRKLSRPFRSVWRGFTAMLGAIVPPSVRRAVTAPFRNLGRWIERGGRGVWTLAEKLNLDKVILPLVRLTRPIWKSVLSLAAFFNAWRTTRKYKQLTWALPAILLFAPLGVVLGRELLFGHGRTTNYYQVARSEAAEADAWDLYHFYDRKLAQLGANNKLRDFNAAKLVAKAGKIERAYEQMSRLAPEETPGFAPAHYWILQRLMKRELGLDDETRMQAWEAHLDHLEELVNEDSLVRYSRALWLDRSNRRPEAIEALAPIVDVFAEAAMLRMRFNLSLDRSGEARNDAAAVRRHMADRDRDRTSKPDQAKFTTFDYESWRIAEQTLGDQREVRRVLEKWVESDAATAEAREALAEMKRQDYERTMQSNRPPADRLSRMLTDAATTASDPRQMLPHLATLYRQREANPVAAAVIEQLLGAEDTPSSFLEALGTLAATGGDWDLGKDLIERALIKDQNNAIAWNNLSWILLSRPEKDVPGAFDAVQKALELDPDNFYFRETRGQIYVLREKWKEAITDLEFALNGLPDEDVIHQSLAKAYDAIGDSDLADMHRQSGR